MDFDHTNSSRRIYLRHPEFLPWGQMSTSCLFGFEFGLTLARLQADSGHLCANLILAISAPTLGRL